MGTAHAAKVPALTAFPVVGNPTYTDDFGAPRPQGRHEGNDIMSIRHQPAVAFESGKVRIWYRSRSSTCMLYLYGNSGMTYVYIHLNNDLTMKNDNDGGCRRGVSYPKGLRTGQSVVRGQIVGFVGDSGDANGLQPHLHFEVRKPSGRAIDPYSFLNRAKRVLYPRPAEPDPVWLAFRKAKVLTVGDDWILVATRRLRLSVRKPDYARRRKVLLNVPSSAVIEKMTPSGRQQIQLSDVRVGDVIWLSTTTFAPSWKTQRAPGGTLSVDHLTVS